MRFARVNLIAFSEINQDHAVLPVKSHDVKNMIQPVRSPDGGPHTKGYKILHVGSS